VTVSRLTSLLAVIVFASCLTVLADISLHLWSNFSDGQPETITFEMNGNNTQLLLENPVVWSIATINIAFLYLGWGFIYIFWHSFKSKQKLQKQMQDARIQQLTNQLSPHFLFNTLNSIRALIFEDQEKAANLVTQLSEIFRTNLQAHLKSKETLEQEWVVARRYLAIEQARLEERLQVEINIDEKVLQQSLPTLSLLTLVENAIKHGIAPNPMVGRLKVNAEVLNHTQWRLSLCNSVSENQADEGTKTGLKNTEDRLRLMFGDKMMFQAIRKGTEFIVTIEMPYV
jgi:LytS/YehU family sensor histidine kinase